MPNSYRRYKRDKNRWLIVGVGIAFGYGQRNEVHPRAASDVPGRPRPGDRGYVAFDFLGVVDQGEAFSPRSVRLLRRLKVLIAIIAAYEVLGFVGVSVAAWVVMGQTKAYMLLGWLAAEVVTLFFFALVALLERLFVTALGPRREN